ncbi:DUF501 domain-containing protein [Bifidobacterium sp. 82T10]|uniref:DUF501 domain-containing protein n=1 Tax=Bifidobacterium miconis TaxID=2834435 RepID=A0ABS6WEQ5_9BIFI|nr:DUF501 domain-containing protein [Bifidobacterium miconis]MBW3092230.1 DUF501 domain-containing protein [Bifidobacterium miconis]
MTETNTAPTTTDTSAANDDALAPFADAAKALVDRCLAEPASDEDIAIVERQLGRYPRGMVAVGARCACGRPLAVVTRPMLPGGIPFPTTCYLTSPEAVKAASHVEAEGGMRDYNELLAEDESVRNAYHDAHLRYLAFRHELALRLGDSEEHIADTSAGGMPTRVKCLHALLAQTLVMGPGANPIGDLTLERIAGEFSPTVCRCAVED